MPATRCFWYEDDGTPKASNIGSGCFKKDSCRFVHPWDREWDSVGHNDGGLYISRSVRRRGRGVRRTRSYSSSRSPSPQSRARNRGYSARRGSSSRATYNKTRSRSESSGSRSCSESRRQHSPRSARTPTLQTPSEPGVSTGDKKIPPISDSTSSAPAQATDQDSSEKEMNIPTAPKALRKISVQAAPRVKSESPAAALQSALPVQPSSTPPPLPSVSVPDETASAREPPCISVKQEDDETSVWMQRVQLLSEAIKSRRQLKQLEEELARYSTFMSTSHAGGLDESGLKKKLASLRWRKIQETSRIQDAVRKLASSGNSIFQRAGPQEQAPVSCMPSIWDLDEVVELKQTVLQLQSALADASCRNKVDRSPELTHREPLVMSVKSASMVDHDSDVDMLDACADAESAGIATPNESSHTHNLQALQGALAEIEERINALETDANQQQQDWEEEAEALIHDRTKDLLEELQQRTPSLEITAQVAKVEAEVRSVGDDLTAIANEVADLIRDHGTLVEVNNQLTEENERLHQLLSETQTTHQSQLNEMREETRALAEMMMRAQQDPCKADHHRLCGLSAQALSEQLHPHLEASLRKQVQPLISDVTQAMEALMLQHNEDLQHKVMPKVTIAVQVAQTIDTWIRNSTSAIPSQR